MHRLERLARVREVQSSNPGRPNLPQRFETVPLPLQHYVSSCVAFGVVKLDWAPNGRACIDDCVSGYVTRSFRLCDIKLFGVVRLSIELVRFLW